MEEANAAAVRAILEPQRYMETGCLDLHGLHVAEAEAASRDFVQQQLALRQFSEIEIITGAGHHSSGQVAKIKCYVSWCKANVAAVNTLLLALPIFTTALLHTQQPAVERILQDMQLNYTDHNEGALVIALVPVHIAVPSITLSLYSQEHVCEQPVQSFYAAADRKCYKLEPTAQLQCSTVYARFQLRNYLNVAAAERVSSKAAAAAAAAVQKYTHVKDDR
eukprot:826-Heterococcus_DN1.PRE.1